MWSAVLPVCSASLLSQVPSNVCRLSSITPISDVLLDRTLEGNIMTITSMWEWLEAGNRRRLAVDWWFNLMGGAVGVYWDPHWGLWWTDKEDWLRKSVICLGENSDQDLYCISFSQITWVTFKYYIRNFFEIHKVFISGLNLNERSRRTVPINNFIFSIVVYLAVGASSSLSVSLHGQW